MNQIQSLTGVMGQPSRNIVKCIMEYQTLSFIVGGPVEIFKQKPRSSILIHSFIQYTFISTLSLQYIEVLVKQKLLFPNLLTDIK